MNRNLFMKAEDPEFASRGGIEFWERRGESGWSGPVPPAYRSAFWAGRLTRVTAKRARLSNQPLALATGLCKHCTGSLFIVNDECAHCRAVYS